MNDPRPPIVLEPCRAVYVDIAKVASTTLKRIFADALGIEHRQSPQLAKFTTIPREDVRAKYCDYLAFAFVRNPWARLLACYRQLIGARKLNDWGKRQGVWKGLLRFGNRFYGEMPFGAFVEQVAQIPDEQADEHFRSQTACIHQSNGQRVVDFVGRLERFELDLPYVCRRIGLQIGHIPHLNKKASGHYREFYSRHTAKAVRTRYRDDVREFGYAF